MHHPQSSDGQSAPDHNPPSRLLVCDADSSVPDWLIEYPDLWSLFQELGIDGSCGGKSLAWAVLQQGLNITSVLRQIRDQLDESTNTES